MTGLFLGHLAGDYLFQNQWMALNKSKNTLNGWMAALIHCVLYTFAVCLFMWNFDPIWIIAVFLTHFPIDKFSLTDKYLHYIKGRSLKDYVKKDNIVNISARGIGSPNEDGLIDEYQLLGFETVQKPPINRYDVLEGSFAAVVYTVTDNTMHLILMWGAYNLIY
jgi:hypothetical protein